MTTENIQRQIERDGREARNVISWRVPNEPQQASSEPAPRPSSAGETSISSRNGLGGGGGKGSGGPSSSSSTTAAGGGVPRSHVPRSKSAGGSNSRNGGISPLPPPLLSPGGDLSPLGKSKPSKRGGGSNKDMLALSPSSGKEEGKNRIRRTFWSYLFRNVNRAVDELYYLCEAETSAEHCEEAAKLLESCSRDFFKLIERIEVQKKFEEEQKKCDMDDAAGSHKAPKGVGWEVRKTTTSKSGQQSAIIMDAIERMSGQTSQDPFLTNSGRTKVSRQNSIDGPLSPTRNGSLPLGSDDVSRDLEKSDEIEEAIGTRVKKQLHFEGDDLLPERDADTLLALAAAEEDEGGEGDEINKPIIGADDMEEATDIEVAKATEEVWAEAEAWVDAEAKAEDEAWARLEEHEDDDLEDVVQGDEDGEEDVDALLGAEDSFDDSRRPLSAADDASFFLSDDPDPRWYALSGDEDLLQMTRSPCGSPKSSFSSPPGSPARCAGTPSGTQGNGHLDFALSRRYLRDKLSSPERKKPTPAEAKRRLDEKHFMADLKRAYLDSERQNRLRQAAERMRDVNERRIRKLALAEKVYEAKLGQAERRQKAHIQAIARKAENETSKVKEVSFINNLTAEGLRATITERLTDVEKRIQAGRARRLEHLHGIKNRQRKKREKAIQMSERRLEMEQMAAERWVTLQARVEAVQERRQTRLLEMLRRLEMAKNTRLAKQQGEGGSEPTAAPTAATSTSRKDKENRGGEEDQATPTEQGTNAVQASNTKKAPSNSDPLKDNGEAASGTEGNNNNRHRRIGNRRRNKSRATASAASAKEDEALKEALAGAAVDLHGTFDVDAFLPKTAKRLRDRLVKGMPSWLPDSSDSPVQQHGGDNGGHLRRFDILVEEIRAEMSKRGASTTAPTEPKADEGGDEKDYDSDDEAGGKERGEREALRPNGPGEEGTAAASTKRRRRKRGKPTAASKSSSASAEGGNGSLLGPCSSVSLESLRALSQVLDTKSEAVLNRIASSGIVSLLVRLSRPGVQSMEGTAIALHALHVALHSASARDRALADHGGAPLVDASLWATTSVLKSPNKGGDPALMSCLSSALSSLTLLIRHVPAVPLAELQLDLLRYALEAQLTHELSELLAFLHGALVEEKQRREEAMRLIGKALSLLEAIAGFPAGGAGAAAGNGGQQQKEVPLPSTEGSGSLDPPMRPVHPLCEEVMSGFLLTQLASGLPTLSALLMDERPHGGYDVQDISPQVLSLSWLVLRTLNHLARLDLKLLQSMLISDSHQSYFNYVYSMLLRVLSAKLSQSHHPPATSKEEIEACLEQLLTILGYYFLNNEASQQTLQTSPILLNRLTNLPFRYFCDEQFKDVLFPTLVTLSFRSIVNKEMMKNEMNTELLVTYVETRIDQRAEAHASVAGEHVMLHDAAAERGDGEGGGEEKGGGGAGMPAWVLLALRFPPEYWQEAAEYFRC